MNLRGFALFVNVMLPRQCIATLVLRRSRVHAEAPNTEEGSDETRPREGTLNRAGIHIGGSEQQCDIDDNSDSGTIRGTGTSMKDNKTRYNGGR